MLTEGASLRATNRVTGMARNTLTKLLVDLGQACSEYQDDAFRNLAPQRVQADEIWSFVGAKAKNVHEGHDDSWGDCWTWTAIDGDTKLIPTWWVGQRTTQDCYEFLSDLRARIVPGHRFQLTTDGFSSYPPVVDSLWRDGIDFAVQLKEYGDPSPEEQRRYSPATCKVVDTHVLAGDPDPRHISTSYIERSNLTLRMGNRRFTRLTNAFSKSIENHAHALAMHFAAYNLVRPHGTLSKAAGRPTTPAMASGVEAHPWSLLDLAGLLD